ncbi:glycoside hydrolase, family 43 [Bisporella sp. PMI_857]|nr:glycoside hydrolase, family 43 [Bisporella sp. PMI_857]
MFFAKAVTAVLTSVTLLASSVNAYANPGACSGDCWAHDPAIVRRADGVYFKFNTGSKIGIWKASALTGPWVYQGAAVPAGSIINLAGKDDLWAPDVRLVGSTYILYYSVSTFGSQNSAIGYATSGTMEYGSWTDHGATGIASSSSKAYNAIDANLVTDTSGKYYMNFGSFWGDIYQAPMNSAGTAVSSSAYQISYTSSGSHAREGSFMFYRSGYYYLFWSEGICCGYDTTKPAAGAEYQIKVCRSTSVSSGFVDKNGVSCTAGEGTTVLASHDYVYGPGGQGIFTDPTYGTVLYYHYANTNIGLSDAKYQFGWNTIGWSGGWPTV